MEWNNPVLPGTADPFLTGDGLGGYYFLHTLGSRIEIRHVSSLSDFDSAQTSVVFMPPQEGPGSRDIWAPEMHLYEGKWHIWFAASDGSADAGRRMHVLQCDGQPMTGEWRHIGMVNTQRPGLDGTLLHAAGQTYFLYAGYGDFPEHGSAIYIAQMDGPAHLCTEETCLTWPQAAWERQGGMPINEGPACLVRGGRVFACFSASTTWSEDYCIGMLWANEQDDLLDERSWHKIEKPVFCKNAAAGLLAPGHNSFCKTEQGDDLIVYHAIEGASGQGDLDMSKRSARIQKFQWTEDGFPQFGEPF